jgi:DNA helicase HerA-like ATPase
VGTEVLKAEEEFVRKIVMLDQAKRGAYVGILEGTSIPVHLDLNKMLTKHVAVLAKSGSGKSYSVGVLLEEIMENNVPLVIVDPHGEYSTLKKENDNAKDIEHMERFNVKPKNYARKVHIYGDETIDESHKPLKLNEKLTSEELDVLLPRLTSSQHGILYSAMKDAETLNFDSLIESLQSVENHQKWNIISMLEHLRSLNLFSADPTSLNELVQSGRCTIINLKGIDPQVQEILVFKLLRDLFHERKVGKVPPFFLVIEEAHNFVPEKGFSDAICAKIIKTIASEGRKFGLGLCVVSQRPAIVQKTVLSQCTTQIILKITNPNDLKAITNSVEGITYETENEIKNLPIGTALVTGIVDMPLIVNFRPRKTKHGGEAVDILGMQQGEEKFFDELKDFNDQKLMPVIKPKLTPADLKLMTSKDAEIESIAIPCMMFLCERNGREFNILMEMVNGSIIQNIEDLRIKAAFLPELHKLSPEDLKVLEKAFKLKSFTLEDFVQKTGMGLDVKKIVQSLTDQEFLILKNGTFTLSEKFILSDIAKHAFYAKIEYQRMDQGKLIEKRCRIDSVKALLSRFTTVKDQRECYLLHYQVK